MKKLSSGIGVLFIIMLAVSSAADASSTRIEIRVLPKVLKKYIGQRITTHGCFVRNIHGNFIQPCGSTDWHEVTLAYDPTYKVISSVFRKPKFSLVNEVEADITGTLVEQEITWPKPGKRIFIKLESLNKVKVYVP